MTKPETKKDIAALLKKEVPFIKLKPYSRKIVGITLGIAAKRFGNDYANSLIDKFDLEPLGWSKVSGQQNLELE